MGEEVNTWFYILFAFIGTIGYRLGVGNFCLYIALAGIVCWCISGILRVIDDIKRNRRKVRRYY